MKMTAIPAAIALLLGPAVTAAPPAGAENPTADGIYHYADDDGGVGTWTIRTTCNPQCVAHVATGAGRSFEAQLVNGRFVNSRVVPDGLECPAYWANEMTLGGGTHAVHVTQWWDPITLTGEVEFSHGAPPCNLDDRHDRFTLSRIG